MDKKYLILFGLGIELVALTIILVYVGDVLDRQMHWNGYGVAGGALVALISWMVHLIFVTKNLEREDS